MAYTLENCNVAVIGLGYVGMPLALMLAKNMPTVGFDIQEKRVNDLKNGWDSNREIRQADLRTTQCKFTADVSDLKNSNVYIVTVPTPIDADNKPDLGAVEAASRTIGAFLKKGDIVVYESTVYPGVTEDVCGPILQECCGLECGKDFFLGYSPERINPGDKVHTVENITKVVAGQTEEVADFLVELYGTVNGGNIFKAKDIRTAEASKAIENAQRDINVAFVNEVAIILDRLGLSSYDVLEAAGTKWNFLNFYPGLVGGHCIGVDPYYLAHCAENSGYQPEVILSGRKTNDSMGVFVADKIDQYLEESVPAEKASILILGFAFKEDINDIRNTKVIDIYKTLHAKGHDVEIHDPFAMQDDVEREYGISLLESLSSDKKYDCVVLAVGHTNYKEMSESMVSALLNDDGFVYDIKGIWRNLSFKHGQKYHSL